MADESQNIIQVKPNATQQVTAAIREVEAQYTKGTQVYAERLRHYTLEINRLKAEVQVLQDDTQEELALLKPIEDSILYSTRLLERLNEAFTQKITLIDTLKDEYENVVDKQTQNTIVDKQKKELYKILDEIEEQESQLLEDELQKLNILAILEPKQREIKELQKQINTLMLDKEHYETSKIMQIPTLSMSIEDEEEVVDIDVIEEDKETD